MITRQVQKFLIRRLYEQGLTLEEVLKEVENVKHDRKLNKKEINRITFTYNKVKKK